MKESVITIVRVLFEVIVLLALLGFVLMFAISGRRWLLQNERNVNRKELIAQMIELKDISNSRRTYTKSEVAEIIVTYKDKYEYVVDEVTEDGEVKQHLIINKGEEFEKACVTAANILDSGMYYHDFDNLGDKFGFINGYLWSSDYLLNNVCILGSANSDEVYKVEILTPDPLTPSVWTPVDPSRDSYEDIVNTQFRIHYLPND